MKSYNTNYYVNSIGRAFPSPDHPVGPCINGVIDCRDQPNPLDGFVIEEGTVPQALAPFFGAMLELMPGQLAPTDLTLSQKVQHLLARQGSKLLGPYYRKGSVESTQIYLIMSHDSKSAEIFFVLMLIGVKVTKQSLPSRTTSHCLDSWALGDRIMWLSLMLFLLKLLLLLEGHILEAPFTLPLGSRKLQFMLCEFDFACVPKRFGLEGFAFVLLLPVPSLSLLYCVLWLLSWSLSLLFLTFRSFLMLSNTI